MFTAMLRSFAQYYPDSPAKHTRKGLKQRALNGLHGTRVSRYVAFLRP